MNEIVRIHIAKISYEVEVAAKKELEAYISKLGLYADDSDWLVDIEIRITEILAERGIRKDGVISSGDVEAIKKQLGDPKEFLGDGDIAVGPDLEKANIHRFYRDPDTAIVGGVLSGIAKYFNINPVWIRLAFIVLLFVSFGSAFVVYGILWLVVPPARSIAEKLQLSGQPVTLTSIKELREREELDSSVNTAPKITQHILIYGLGTLFAIGAVASLAITGVAGFYLASEHYNPLFGALTNSFWQWAALGLFIVSGLLLAALSTTASFAFFKKQCTKRIVTTLIALTISGVIAFTTGIGLIWYDSWQNNRIYSSRSTEPVSLPTKFSEIKGIAISTDGKNFGSTNIEYVVAADAKPYYTVSNIGIGPQPKITSSYDESGDTATLQVVSSDKSARYQQAQITIYGPSLTTVHTSENILFTYSNKDDQSNVMVSAEGNSNATIVGTYDTATISSKDGAEVDLSVATIRHLLVELRSGRIAAGVVQTLTVTQPDACPANMDASDYTNRLVVQAVSGGKITYNGAEKEAKTIENPCGWMVIGSDSQ